MSAPHITDPATAIAYVLASSTVTAPQMARALTRFAQIMTTHPIVTVSGPGLTLSQGPTVDPADTRRGGLPTTMSGHLQVRIGETQTAWGVPVATVRRGEG